MQQPYLLALDVGVASIGWALLDLDVDGTPLAIRKAGVHSFDAGETADFLKGKDESPAVPRRLARQLRKMIWRRARRKRKLLRILQSLDLLPAGEASTPAAIDAYVKQLDAALRAKWEKDADHRARQVLPYRLRAAALDRPLERHEFGRALYHLAQRRGFLSNRKSRKEKAESKVVKKGISELEAEMAAAGARTLGEYFSKIDPEQVRLRRRWTSRQMYQTEFQKMWSAQAAHHGLSDQHKKQVHETIFFQRPLKSVAHLIGRCRYLPFKRRAPLGCRLAQRFRVLQKLNDLSFVDDLGMKTPLDEQQRTVVLDVLTHAGSVKLAGLRKRLAVPRHFKFNFETEGEKSLPGLVTDAKLRDKIAECYDALTGQQKDTLVDELLSATDEGQLQQRLQHGFGLTPEQAKAVAEIELEDGYLGLSRLAVRRLLPYLEQGVPYMTAVRRVFPESLKAAEPKEQLPPVNQHLRDIRNPTVLRGLTELRKLVNAVIRRYGKPQRIHIELLRELKKSKKQRERIAQENYARRKERQDAIARIAREVGVQNPSVADIEKVLLADECHWHCPYTGKSFGWHDLLGSNPQVDVEHIWPFARSLDNSFINKTLCFIDENRNRKRNRMPAEAYSPKELEEILRRVARFESGIAKAKLERFKATEMPEGFTERHLRESSYFARLACEYLGLLYGGVTDQSGSRRVQTRSGTITWWLRREWGLNAVLSDRDEKNRADHRHHAVDAIVIGCCDQGTVQKLTDSAVKAQEMGGHRLLAPMDLPWPSFRDDAQKTIDAIIVSFRQSRRIAGPIHAETIYTSPMPCADGKARCRVRKPLTNLSARDIDAIIDPRIRDTVRQAFEASGAPFADPKKHPVWTSRSGKSIPVHSVRIETGVTDPMSVGRDERLRHVDSTGGSNHHARIIAKLAGDGQTEKSWYDQIVTRAEIYARKAAGQPPVDKTVPPGCRFKFSLAANEYVELDELDDNDRPTGQRAIYRVLSISEGDFELCRHNDGRTAEVRKKAKERVRVSAEKLRKRHVRKVFVNYLGEVKDASG